ncbi:hypothetical protein HK100_006890 [Physocladia obscura]|uniref:Uncharacterized protein n=1 Tax=Physocladia obscura TaxID=109957 RepID=A0AAD5XBG3_9FUNG|nr:hypothetical protein HK100_006890 [Physocladia obscura]
MASSTAQLLQTEPPKPCKQHGVLKHDLFTSYRVEIDGDFVAQLVSYIENIAARRFCRRVCVFLDSLCLNDGANWRDGFLDGLHGSYVVLYVLSEESVTVMIENVKNGDWPEPPRRRLLPILVDKEGNRFSEIAGSGTLFNPVTYPDLPHVITKKNFRGTMAALFLNQAIHIVPDLAKIHDVAYDIVDLIAPLSGTSGIYLSL